MDGGRTLIVAHRTAATPLLLEEVKRRASQGRREFDLLVPDVQPGEAADALLEQLLPPLKQASGGEVRALVGGPEPLPAIRETVRQGNYDEVVISTLPRGESRWLRLGLPRAVRELGVPVTVVTPVLPVASPVPVIVPPVAAPAEPGAGVPVELLGEPGPWTAVERLEPGEPRGAVIRLSSVAALGGFLFGYDSSVINGAVTAIGDHFHAGALVLGLVVSSALLGAAAGSMLAGTVADRFGRLPAMWLASALFLASAVGTGLSTSLGMLAALRVIGGVAIGVASVIAPAYIAEIAPARIRGQLGSLQQLAIVLGIFLSLLVDYILASIAGSPEKILGLGLPAWRWMFIAMVVPSLAYGLLALTIPESPRFLVARGRLDDASAVLRQVLGNIDLKAKVAQIRDTLSREIRPSLADLKGPALGLLPIVWVGIGLSVFQQFVGINVIFYYSSVLWQAVGFSQSNSLLITVITSVVNVGTTLVAIGLIDRSGRRPLLLVGSAGMTVTLGIMAYIFGSAPIGSSGTPVLHGVAGPIALVAANAFVFFFGMSWGPVVWVLLGEKFPNRIRAAALSVAAAAQWVANWVVSTSFPSLKDAGLGLAYGIYAGCALLSLLFVLRFVSETRGKELEAMTLDIGRGAVQPSVQPGDAGTAPA